MGYTVPTTEPNSLRAGDTWQWTRENLSDYPAPTWTLTYYFRNASSYFNVVATASGSTFAVSVAPATTAGRPPGQYDWTAFVSNGSDRYQVGIGRLEVLPDPANASPYDGRSFARTMLEAVEDALISKATSQQLDLVQAALADRSMQYNPAALMTLRSQLSNEVKREQAAQTGTDDRRLLVRFG